MNIVLVNSGNDPGIGGNANAQSYPPLGIISLGTVLKRAFGNAINLTLLDGQVDTTDEIVGLIRSERPELVGVSMYCTSVRNTLRIVREAKGSGATTLLGNDHASFHAENLLRKVPEIDYICTGDVGEQTIVQLVGVLLQATGTHDDISDRLAAVSHLALRHDGAVVKTAGDAAAPRPAMLNIGGAPLELQPLRVGKAGRAALDELPVPDRSLLPRRYWEAYLSGFRSLARKVFDTSGVTGVATINRARGCARSRQPCRYCGIADLTPRGSSGDMFWADVRAARDQVNATVLYEAFDSATSWPDLLRRWADAKPDDLSDTRFFMYAQASETNAETISLFKRLGVFCINTGFDSGDTTTLQLLKGQRDSLEVNRNAARMWTDAGVEIYTSFVLVGLGSESETRRSLDRTLEFAEWLADSTSTVSLDSAMLYPDKSSLVGSWIWDPQRGRTEAQRLGWTFVNFDQLDRVSKKWRESVELDPLELCGDFARVCGVEPDVLLEYDRAIERISESRAMNFGRSQGGPVA